MPGTLNTHRMQTADKEDKYISGMDWNEGKFANNVLQNYRKYQYNLVGKYMGKAVLEVGSGDRGFTIEILRAKEKEIERLVSIEPSITLYEGHMDNFSFPANYKFSNTDLFDLKPGDYGKFDTAVFIHVLEHIEQDKKALDHTHTLLEDNGRVLIEVPALQFLFSVHDEMLGHYRRYNKKMLRSIIDPSKYKIEKIWYNDPIGVLGSWYFFKFKKIKLKSDEGKNLVSSQGGVYDKYIIPFEGAIEKFITFPFGLSLNAVLKKI
jgi:2-polyprenyl-3-methyl-5-hydroxy-6-metoxy-1,4-benzoquinol methylase